MTQQRLVIGISGASGAILGIRALEMTRALGLETHLVISQPGEMTIGYETDRAIRDVKALAHTCYTPADVGAAISSGSFETLGMLIAPCSIRTVSEIATGVTTSLLTRAADVTLKERRPLVLMVREMPLHVGHLRTMTAAAEIGATIMPPVPAFYAGLTSVDDMVTQMAGRALDQLGIEAPEVRRWGDDLRKGRRRPQ